MSKEFTHLNKEGMPSMVDVGHKRITSRRAVAEARVYLPEPLMEMLEGDEIRMPKGPVFQTAIIAGVMGAKKTGELIPLCHPLGMDHCEITIKVNGPDELVIQCVASVEGKTGIEMEALTGASIAALTVYDMCKALSHDIEIRSVRLLAKMGGKSDFSRK